MKNAQEPLPSEQQKPYVGGKRPRLSIENKTTVEDKEN